MVALVKRVFTAIAKRRKVLTWVFVAILAALTGTLALYKFPVLRIPTGASAIGTLLILFLWLFPKWQVRSTVGLDSKDRFDRENEARKTISTILGGLAFFVTAFFTWQSLEDARRNQATADKATQENLRIAQEGQITDRFTKAIAQLGDAKLEISLGGIYALERIDRDSPKDHWPIMEVLTAYVREHAKIRKPDSAVAAASMTKDTACKPPVDIQAILTVLGRRTLTFEKGENNPLNLSQTDLKGADLWVGNFARANFDDADLRGAHFGWARLRDARLRNTNLRGADFYMTDLTRAQLHGADLTETIRLQPEQLALAEGNAETKLPPDIPRPKSWQ